ncbi:hypothetical protein EHQ46_15775 [Leptospira yanagawae]|uniref:DUF1206 domain-containing protein n=1 Tax=Leptospira yanagawae TaxID=293069 RepID=A0ABY2LXX9_9LEPT|nr:hypothetical protein [Leptospira yanagawae]TGL17914.1 hypothetical protein EHQ46_15775 [Leptospira yanagawae]
MATKKEVKESRQSQLQRESQERINKFHIIATSVSEVFIKAISAAKYGLIAYFTYLSIKELSGKETLVWVSAQISDLISIDGFKFVSGYLVAILMGILYFNEKRSRKAEIKKNASKNSRLEKIINSKRKGSGLTELGENPTGDKK